MDWVNVKDRLPEYTAQAIGNRFVSVIASFNGFVCETLYEEGVWKPLTMNLDGVKPTHWMPLPEPPIGGCGKESKR